MKSKAAYLLMPIGLLGGDRLIDAGLGCRTLHNGSMYPGHLIPRNIYMKKTDTPIAGCAHQAGTCRFGAEATSSLRVGDHLIGRLI